MGNVFAMQDVLCHHAVHVLLHAQALGMKRILRLPEKALVQITLFNFSLQIFKRKHKTVLSPYDNRIDNIHTDDFLNGSVHT